MALERIERYAARILRESPEPPRRISLVAVLIRAHTSQQNLVLLAAAAVFLGAAVWWLTSAGVDDKALLGITFGAAALIAVGGVVLWARRIAWALHNGLRSTARINTLHVTPAGPLHARTLDGMSNGMASGARRVAHPSGDFKDDFRIEASWATQLSQGDEIEVVVHPDRKIVLLDIRIL